MQGLLLPDALNAALSRGRRMFGLLTSTVIPPEPVGLSVGFSASYNEGVSGDIFVSPSGNDTTGTGSIGAPYATIAKAAAELSSSKKVIRLRAGTYREGAPLNGKLMGTQGAPVVLARYGDEPVTVSGFDLVTGWALCTSEDQGDVGANWGQVYKVTRPKSSFPGGDPLAANIHEDGERLRLAAGKSSKPTFPWTDNALSDWLIADEAITDTVEGVNRLLGYKLAAITSKYTPGQIASCRVVFHASPNSAYAASVVSASDGNILLSEPYRQYETNENRNRFILLNLLPAIRSGGWGFKDNGDDTVTLYVRPLNAANMAGKIEVSARTMGVNLTASSHVEVRGLIIEGFASAGTRTDGQYSVSASNSSTAAQRENLKILNNLIRRSWRSYDGYGCIFKQNVHNTHIKWNTIEDPVGQFGMFLFGPHHTSALGSDSGDRVLYNLVSRSDKAPVRIYGGKLGIVGGNIFLGTGQASHANKGNIYEGGWKYLWHRNAWFGCDGYLAWQEASSIHVGMNFVPGGYAGGATAIRDQNNATASPAKVAGVNETSLIFNNATPPFKGSLSYDNSLFLGTASEPNVFYSVHNNLLHGSALTNANLTSWSHNMTTIGPAKDPTDAVVSVGAVWTNTTTGNLTIKETSPSWTSPAASILPAIEELEALFPDYPDLRKDLSGKAFDPSVGFIGCYAPGSDQLPHPVVWVEAPGISGISVVGGTLTVDAGYMAGYPRPVVTRRWVVSFDDWESWSVISGAAGTSFSPTSAQLGGKIGVITTAGGKPINTFLDAVVTGGYPLGKPSLVAERAYPSNATSYTMSAVPFSGKPAIIFLHGRNGVTTTDNVITVATAAGTFEATALKARRGAVEVQAFLCKAPVAGAHDVTITGELTTNSAIAQVVEVEGLDSIGLLGTGGSTSNGGWSQSVSSTVNESGVMFLYGRLTADPANPITLSGHEVSVFNSRTADNAGTTHITVAAGYKDSETVGSYSIPASWPTAASSYWLAVELKAAP